MMASSRVKLVPTYIVERMGLAVRIDPDLPKTVVFIGVHSGGAFHPEGTGFLVSMQVPGIDEHFIAVVTASHVIDNLSPEARAKLAVRVNSQNGPADILPVDLESRYDHPKKAADTTILSVPLDPAIHDFKMTVLDRTTYQKDAVENGELAGGDQVAAIGLYTSHHGQLSNIPVLRFGHVASISDEPVRTKRGYTEGFLIELRTIAGLSGSPVFRTFDPIRLRGGKLEQRMSDVSGGVLLGMLVGYHMVDKHFDQIQVPRDGMKEASGFGDDYTPDELNTGFGVVIPLARVFEIFEGDAWKRNFEEALALHKARNPFHEAGNFALLTFKNR